MIVRQYNGDDLDDMIYGLYILHPNNVGRCGHISNASFAVSKKSRGMHIGEKLVKHCIKTAREQDCYFRLCSEGYSGSDKGRFGRI